MAVVATIRPACDGLFGPCVAVEEGTTNLLAGSTDVTLWSKASISSVNRVPGGGPDGSDAYEIIATADADPRVYRYISTGAPLGGRTFTFSSYMKLGDDDSANPVALFIYDNSVGDPGSANYTITRTWRRYTFTKTFSAGETDSTMVVRYDLGDLYNYTSNGAKIYVAMPQVEEKPFATSFVDGTRASGALDYSPSVLDYRQGTVALWWRYHAAAVPARNWSMLFSAQDHTPTSEYNKINIGLNSERTIRFRTSDQGAPTTDDRSASVASFQDGSWHFAAMTWDTATGKKTCVLDDQVVFDGVATALPEKQPDYLHVGSWVGTTYFANTLISNLLILKHAVTADTMLEWYALQKPFFDPSPMLSVPAPSGVSLSVA